MTKRKVVEVDISKQAQAINKIYCSVNDIMTITALSYPRAVKLAKEIISEMEERGEFILSRKPILLPTKKVLRKLGLNASDFTK